MSRRTRATPGPISAMASAAACERSMMRFSDEGAAVGDADVDGFVVGEIDDAHPGSEGQGPMRGSELFHVVDLAVGGGAAMIRMAVPACEAGFAVSDFSSAGAWRQGCGGGVMLLRASGERETGQYQRGAARPRSRVIGERPLGPIVTRAARRGQEQKGVFVARREAAV